MMCSRRLEYSSFSPSKMTLYIWPILQAAQGIHSFDSTGFQVQNCWIAQEFFQKDLVTWCSLYCIQQIGSTMKHLVKSIFAFLSFPFFCSFTVWKSIWLLLGRMGNVRPYITSIFPFWYSHTIGIIWKISLKVQ